MSTFNLGIGIPSGPEWPADFAMCLLNLVLFMVRGPVPGFTSNSVKIFNKRTSLLPKSRQELVQDALDAGCSHLLFVDSDQTFPSNLVHMLAKHGKNVIGCNIAVRMIPSSPTARNKHPTWPGGEVVYSNGRADLEQVWRLGTGVMLINLQIMKHLAKPWFSVVFNEELNDFYGADWYFCEQLEKAGIAIWVDHAASQEVGHIGRLTYEHAHIEPKAMVELAAEEAARLKLVNE